MKAHFDSTYILPFTSFIRQASVPSANGHFSARALAKYYSNLQLHTPQTTDTTR